jgi:hypothetical protein
MALNLGIENGALFDAVFWREAHKKNVRWIARRGDMICLLDRSSPRPTAEGERWVFRPTQIINMNGDTAVVRVVLHKRLYKASEEIILKFEQGCDFVQQKREWRFRAVEGGMSIVYIPDRNGPQPTTSDTRWKGVKGVIVSHDAMYTRLVVAVPLKEEIVSERALRRRERKARG